MTNIFSYMLILLSFGMFYSMPMASAQTGNITELAVQRPLMTGAQLLQECNSRETVDIAACQSYILAILDYHNLIQGLGTAPTVDFCLPPSTTIEDMVGLVVTYLENNRTHNSFVAAPAVAMAFFETYPCQ